MLAFLPPEILTHIVLLLDPLSIRRCHQLCRKLTQIVKAAPLVQFILELDSLEYSQPKHSRKDLGYVDKIEVLREHNARLLNLGSAQGYEVDIERIHSAYALNNSPGLFTFAHGNSSFLSDNNLDCVQLASRNRGTTTSTWALENLGVDFTHAIADPDSDLLVLFERPPDENLVKVHLRSVRSGGDHLAVLHHTIVAATRPLDGIGLNIDAQIIGSVLAIIITAIDGATHIVVWDWTSGAQLTNTYLFGERFLFATDSEFATTRDTRQSANIEASIGSINIYAYSSSTLREKVRDARRIASFNFPIRGNIESCNFRCVYCPSILKSNSPLTPPPKIFDLAPNQQWLQLQLTIAEHGSLISDNVVLYVSFGALLDMARSTSAGTKSRVAQFRWAPWAKHTAWMPFLNFAFYCSGYVYGSRAAYLTSDEDTMAYTLSILDLSLRGAKMGDRRSLEPVDPSVNSFARSLFKGSHQPTVISSFNLENEIFGPSVAEPIPEAIPVMMMDEDHLVIHIQSAAEPHLSRTLRVYDL